MMRVKPETVEWLLETKGVFSEQYLCILPQVADSMSAVCRSMGFRSKNGTDTSTDLVNLSNDSMSTRGKAFTDRAKSLDIQLYM